MNEHGRGNILKRERKIRRKFLRTHKSPISSNSGIIMKSKVRTIKIIYKRFIVGNVQNQKTKKNSYMKGEKD